MAHVTTIIGCLMLMIGAAAQHAAPDAVASLQGKWTVTTLAFRGQPMKLPPDEEMICSMIGDKYEQSVNGKVDERGTFTVDATKKPIAIDFTILEGSAQKSQVGIVEVTGDTIRFLLSRPGESVRPADFATPGPFMLIVAKKKPQ